MKFKFSQTVIFSLITTSVVFAADDRSTNALTAPPDPAKVSYALGMNLGQMEKASKNPAKIDTASFIRAISDVLDNRETDLKPSEIRDVLEKSAKEGVTNDAERKKSSYAAGMRMALQIQSKFPDAQGTDVTQGFYDALSDKPTKVNPADVNALLKQGMEWGHLKQAQKNKIEGDAFIVGYAKQPGVKPLAGDVQYRVLKAGTGATPSTNDQVYLKIRGRSANGKLIVKHNHYLTRCGGGCKGWQEALPRMKIGSRWEVVIPPAMGFGEEGEPGWGIGPNATMVWTFEMVSVAPPNSEFGHGRLGHAFEDSDIPDTDEDKAVDAAEAALFTRKS